MVILNILREHCLETEQNILVMKDTHLKELRLFIVKMMEHILMLLLNAIVSYNVMEKNFNYKLRY